MTWQLGILGLGTITSMLASVYVAWAISRAQRDSTDAYTKLIEEQKRRHKAELIANTQAVDLQASSHAVKDLQRELSAERAARHQLENQINDLLHHVATTGDPLQVAEALRKELDELQKLG